MSEVMSEKVCVSQDYLDDLRTKMIANYISWQSMDGARERSEIQQQMADEFAESLDFEFGSKYIKIVAQGSVRGFIVNTDKDKKFAFGDMLMAASWSAPARNFARGNIFEEADRKNVRWTGVA